MDAIRFEDSMCGDGDCNGEGSNTETCTVCPQVHKAGNDATHPSRNTEIPIPENNSPGESPLSEHLVDTWIKAEY